MKIYVRVENNEGTPLEDALVQIQCQELDTELEATTGKNGKLVFELDSGYLDNVRCLVFCNGARQGTFSVSDGDELSIR